VGDNPRPDGARTDRPMPAVSAVRVCPAPLALVEQRWYALDGWPAWVDGLERIEAVEGDWPRAGAVVRWSSGPAGRGAVRERVVEYEPGVGQSLEVEDPAISGRQTVRFAPVADGVEVALHLDYRLRRHPLAMWLVDRLFVARAMRTSLETTLGQFAARLEMGA
jgi:hypothetical protein